MAKITIDRYDLALLDALQRKGNATNATLGEQIRLSASQISRRIQRLEEDGVIAGYVALLDPESLGLGVTAFAQVILERHGDAASEAFETAIAALPEVTDCFSVSGDADYMLRLVVPDLAAFSQLMMKNLLRLPGVARIKTSIALHTVKRTHVLPIDHLTQPSKPRQRVRYAES
ncbi:MAG: Lrp/AsnC family transcriptional regulator [Candidatus Accumulibacter sp.]|jgi:Lrp/AsnC family leucine-responsive transcriptional regulator|uniref:Lrp/AsnC family transcriptional regulator n=1 Tax=Candidatus Accumulibacter affinis TaxID=2954384 RepID=A0A935TKI1_9PROT|nr:Lrp/AsnC family transcriptional regulator [Candidatus Accumulibacter affinis]MBP9805463.1 Lrp/AsnC family transcriptional regulator [Accumulibacter sp.]